MGVGEWAAIAVGLSVATLRFVAMDSISEMWEARKLKARAARFNCLGTCESWDPAMGMGVIASDDVGRIAVDRSAVGDLELRAGDRVAFDWTEPAVGVNGFRRKAVVVRRPAR